LPGYFQPVEIRAPQGVRISLAAHGEFTESSPAPLNVGLLIAPVYRLRVSNIAEYEGQEVFPTIELIDRLYPPAGERRRFPIPIDLTEEDLRFALEGKYVTRVVYLEDPEIALPIAQRRGEQDWFDAGVGVNPVQEADHWGRPLAIIRIGGRVPDFEIGADDRFMHGSPPFTMFMPRRSAEHLSEELGPRSALRSRKARAEVRTVR
jgi:hypothetical protein